MGNDLHGLAEAVNVINATGEVRAVYRQFWQMVVNGLIPAERLRGRWYVRRHDLPRIIEILRQHSSPVEATGTVRRRAAGAA